VKAGDCDDAWNSTYARPKALRPWRPLPSFLPSPRLVYSFTLRTAAPASDLFVDSFTKPLLHVPFLFPPQSFFLAATSSWSPAHSKLSLSLSHSSNLFRFVAGWLYSSISCLPVTWFVDNLFGNSVIPWTKKSPPAVEKFSVLRMAEEEEEEQ